MNMISTAFPIETDASNKQSELVKKLTSVWEKKNSKAARAGGMSLMALSLAACGAEDDTPFSQADVTAAATAATTAAETVAASAAVEAAADAFVAQAAAVAAAEFVAGVAAEAAAAAALVAQADAVAAAEFVAGLTATATAATVATAAAAAQATAVAAATTAAEAAATTAAATLKVTTDAALAAQTALYDALVAPQSLSLTAATAGQTLVGRSGADTFTGAATSIDAADVIIDASVGDGDVANLTFGTDLPAMTITNVETINVTISEVAVAGAAMVDADKFTGVTTLNVSKADVVVGGSTLTGDKSIKIVKLAANDVANVVAGAGTTTFSGNQNQTVVNTGVNFDLDLVSGSSIVTGSATVNAAGAGLGDTVTVALSGTALQDAKAVSVTTNAENIVVGAFTGNITVDGVLAKDVAMAGVAGGATINVAGEFGTGISGTDGVTIAAIDATGVTLNTTYTGTATAPSIIQINGTGAATDVATISGNGVVSLDNNALVETLNLSGNSAAATFNNTNLIATNVTLTGTQNVTYADAAGDLNGVTLTDSSTGTSTLQLNGAVSGSDDLSFIATDKVLISSSIGMASGGAGIVVGANADITISNDQTTGINIDGKIAKADINITTADDTAASGAIIDITTTTFDAATNIDAVNLTASVGKFTATTTLLATDSVLTISGTKDVGLGITTAKTINAAASTGKISLDTNNASLTSITTGSGADTVTVDQAAAYTVNLGDGNNNLTMAAGISASGSFTTGSGNDIVAIGDADSQVLVTGAGSDSVTIAHNIVSDAIIVMGDGVDTLTLSDTDGWDVSGAANFAVTGVETINISALTSGTVTLSAAQFANDNAFVLSGNAIAVDTMSITNVGAAGATIDASNVTHDATQASTLILTGKAALKDIITGSAKNDTITATTGGDSIDGGLGTDTFNASSLAAATVEGANTGTSIGAVINMGPLAVTNTAVLGATTGYTANTVTSVAQSTYGYIFAGPNLGSVINSAKIGTISGIENVNGTGGTDYIVGSAAANQINGGNGTDVLFGGAGNDTFIVTTDAESGDDVFNGGTDSDTINVLATTVFSSADTNIVAVENITLVGTTINLTLTGQTDGFTITGTAAVNVIKGSNGADTIITGTGADTIHNLAGGGVDTITFSAGGDVDIIISTSISGNDYFNAIGFLTTDKIDYNGAVARGTKAAVNGNEDGTIRADVSLAAATKTAVLLSTSLGTDVIDNYIAGSVTLAALKTAAIVSMDDGNGAAGVSAGLDAALNAASIILVAIKDSEDTSIWRFDNEVAGGANTTLAAEIELIGIIQGDLYTAAELGTGLI